MDFAFITQIKDEPLALLVLGGMVLLKAIEEIEPESEITND